MVRNRDYPLYEREEYESFNQMVCRKAQKCGDKLAFQYMRGKTIHNVTYQQYFDDVLITGKYLSAYCGEGSHIAILGENSYQWLVAFMAIVMSGNVAVPLDKELDTAGIQDLMLRSHSTICVYSDIYEDVVQELVEHAPVKFLSMRTLEQTQKSMNADYTMLEKWSAISTSNMSALFFTSGTSGKSKGVMLSQENMISNITSCAKSLFLGGTAMAILPFHHAFGLLTSVFNPFNCEYTVFINSSLKNIKRDMMGARPQMLLLVPLFVETFYKTIWQTAKKQGAERKLCFGIIFSNFLLGFGIDIRKRLFRSVLSAFGGELKYIICGGAPLQKKYVQEFRSMGIEVLNGYGITECSPVVAANCNLYHRDGSVGQILQGCQVRIQNSEIQVQGKNVMLGYYQDEVFTQDAFEGNWFRTGDLGHIDADGFLFVTGRAKNLIILSNAENVSPEELENLLLDYELVKEALVYAENEVITAEVFPDPETNVEDMQEQIQNIVNDCNRKLPAYKRIQRLKVRQTEFPKTTTQKIKR